MAQPAREQRRSRRLPVRLPVSVKAPGVMQECATKDISSSGIFFYCDADLAPGSRIEVVLVLPEEITGTEPRWVCSYGKVVRVEEPSAQGQRGVVAELERLDCLPEIGI